MSTEYGQAKRNIRGKEAAIICCFAFVLLLGLGIFLFHASPVTDEFEYELGDRIDMDLESYLKAGPLAYKLADPDFSEIDALSPGTYDVTIRYLFRTFEYEINITDTVSPVIVTEDGPLFFRKGNSITPADLIKNIKDADREVSVVFDSGKGEDRIACDTCGTFTTILTAFDSSGNSSECIVEYTVDTPPEIEPIPDIYLTSDATGSLLSLASAHDDKDGELTSSVTVSSDIGDLVNENGDHTVTFSVTDSSGFTTECAVPVYVDSPEKIQEMIGNREISRFTDSIIGAINPYDSGLSSCGNVMNAAMEAINAVVNVKISERDGSTTTGSGFIAEISDGTVYIITNRHVVGESEEAEIAFYESETAVGTVLGVSDKYDVAVIAVDLASLPEGFDDHLSTVHIDLTYWYTLDENILLSLVKLNSKGEKDHTSSGTLVEKRQLFDYFTPHIQTEMALNLIPGDSGSAVFDINGRLICMAFAYSIAPERDWAVPLDEIVKAYEEITGRTLYTY